MQKAALPFAIAMALFTQDAARADDPATWPAYWGSPSVDGGKRCATLGEIRDNIDRIDQGLVKLLAERQSCPRHGPYLSQAFS